MVLLALAACVGPAAGPGGPPDSAADTADTTTDTADPGDGLRVDLRWIPDVGDADWDTARAGLWWALSNLGAAPADEGALRVQEQGADGVVFTLDLGAVGFPEARLPDVAAAVAPVRAWSSEPVDLGRFLMATLYEPGRYYAITGACATLEEWRAARLAPEALDYAVTLSLLVPGERLIRLNPAGPAPGGDTDAPADTDDTAADDTGAASLAEAGARVAGLGFLASEGEGSLADGSFVAHEYETVDVMPNGQQRYAVYDASGALLAGAETTVAGQPGKCMWCHEHRIQRGAAENPGVPGYLDYAAFAAEVDVAEAWMERVRAAAPVVDFAAAPAVHEHAERLTLVYLEPSAARVALEWGVPVEEVLALGLATHTNPEFPELGDRLARADVDAARALREPGWAPLDVPASDREAEPGRALLGAEALACTPGASAR